jgi:hypothetical protein
MTDQVSVAVTFRQDREIGHGSFEIILSYHSKQYKLRRNIIVKQSKNYPLSVTLLCDKSHDSGQETNLARPNASFTRYRCEGLARLVL